MNSHGTIGSIRATDPFSVRNVTGLSRALTISHYTWKDTYELTGNPKLKSQRAHVAPKTCIAFQMLTEIVWQAVLSTANSSPLGLADVFLWCFVVFQWLVILGDLSCFLLFLGMELEFNSFTTLTKLGGPGAKVWLEIYEYQGCWKTDRIIYVKQRPSETFHLYLQIHTVQPTV